MKNEEADEASAPTSSSEFFIRNSNFEPHPFPLILRKISVVE